MRSSVRAVGSCVVCRTCDSDPRRIASGGSLNESRNIICEILARKESDRNLSMKDLVRMKKIIN